MFGLFNRVLNLLSEAITSHQQQRIQITSIRPGNLNFKIIIRERVPYVVKLDLIESFFS